MTASPFSRRKALGALALGGLGAGAAACAAPAPQVFPAWDLADKVVANRAKVKMIGNIAGGRVFSFMRMNIYGDANTGPYTPLFTMNNLIIDDWTTKALIRIATMMPIEAIMKKALMPDRSRLVT